MFAIRFGMLACAGALAWAASGGVPQSEGARFQESPLEITLTGRVTDVNSGQPLKEVLISVVGENKGTETGADGRYTLTFEELWAGRTVTLVAQSLGFKTQRKSIQLKGESNSLDFALDSQAIRADSISVAAQVGRLEEARERLLRAATPSVVSFMSMDASMVGGGLPGRYNPNFNTEGYNRIEENVFLAAATNPLSTFSIDVDRASYANVRRFIHGGMRPPIDAVRIEELINYFPYSDAAPEGDAPLAVYAEVAPAPWQPLHRLVRVALKGRSVEALQAPAGNLVFLLDVSGSMSSPDKLPLLKTAFGMLVDQLRPQDRVAIVVYAGAAGLALPSTPGSEKESILDAIQELEAGGSTAGGAGIQLAYRVAADNHIEGGNNRVILATDGDFNIGASSDAAMIRLIEEKREQGTFLTVLGFGTGNLQDGKMEQIADHGNGNFSYIDNALEAKKVLVNELGGTLLTIAKDVKLQVEFNPTRVAAYRLIGYENRLLAAEDFEDDTKDAGELGAGHSVTALYEVIPVGVESPVEIRGLDSLRYQTTANRPGWSDSPELLFVKLRYKEPDEGTSRLLDLPVMDRTAEASNDFRFASAVAAWGMLLRESEFCAGYSLHEVAELARGAMGADPDGYRGEFLRLVEAANSLELLEKEPGIR
jgi:Ca-activated chloride channel family protein